MTNTEISTDTETILNIARQVLEREAQALAGLVAQINDSFADVVRAVLTTPGKVITTGTGTSGMMAERMAHLLAVSGTPAFYLPCLDALHGGMGSVAPTDLVIALSKGGQSTELIQLVTRLGERGIRVVAVTERPESAFAAAADTVVALRTEPASADIGELIATGSTLVAGAWGDALAAVLMQLRDYSWTDVIATHPGGIVGQQTELPGTTAPPSKTQAPS
jgi:D-arabinose 5-phosphate isomerase GutQ